MMDTVSRRGFERCTLMFLATTSLAAVGHAGPAYAQATPPSAATPNATIPAPPSSAAGPQAVDGGDIVVTASRAASGGFASATPTNVISSEALSRQMAPSIAEILYQEPAFKESSSPSANNSRVASPAQAVADLRGLGAQRTLVLVNGNRMIPQAVNTGRADAFGPDLNAIPTLMIERVEVVTGGASAQWGTNAVAGVVNIILRNQFEGLEVTAQNSVAEAGDNASRRFGAIAGTSFAGGRGHIVAAIDMEDKDAAGDIYSRDWGRKEYSVYTNTASATNGLPVFLVLPQVYETFAPGGLIRGPASFPLRNQTFNEDGSLRPYQFGSLVSGTAQVGGEGLSSGRGIELAPEVRHISPYLRAQYEFSSNLTGFVELAYSYSRGAQHGSVNSRSSITVRNDNPYLSQQVVDAMTAAGLTSFTMNRVHEELPRTYNVVTNKTSRVAAGLQGSLGKGWDWDAQFTWGQNRYLQNPRGSEIIQNFTYAADAVRSNGSIVCRATVPGPDFRADAAGCVPINIFGPNNISIPASEYFLGNPMNRVVYKQTTASANLRGSPFSTWAGEVNIAAGGEYRKEHQTNTVDAIAEAGGYRSGNGLPLDAGIDVTEGYLEANVPLAKDMAFARSLVLNAAVRHAYYSEAGAQTTWKLGTVYEPLDGLRFRVTHSRDLRAPIIAENFGSGTVTNALVTLNGITATIPVNLTAGNPDLDPEIAKTTTVGVVLEPKGMLRGLRMSLDYYNINLKGAILSLPQTTIANLCALGQQRFCALYQTDPVTGAPTALLGGFLNASSLQTIGYDLAVNYRWSPQFTTNLTGTYTSHAYVDLGTGKIDRAGENSSYNTGAQPRFQLNMQNTYANGPFSFSAQVRYISKGKFDNTWNTSPTTTANRNRVPAVAYLNLFSSYRFGKLELKGAIFNVFDKDPPVVPQTSARSATNGQLYDKFGRTFRVGLTYRY